jgi:hypothetical protein
MNTTTLTTELLNFIEDLRSAGYNIGMSQYVAAQDLILGLAAQGNLPSNLTRLRTLLAPILCKSSKQQAEFQHYFAAWIEQFETVTPVVTPTSEVAVELQAIKTGSKLWKLVFGVFAVVFVAAIYFSFPTSGWECLSQRSALYDCMMQSIKTDIPNPEVGNEKTLVNDFIERGSKLSSGRQQNLTVYWRWILYTYGPQILDYFGTFRFLMTELVPLQLITQGRLKSPFFEKRILQNQYAQSPSELPSIPSPVNFNKEFSEDVPF